MRRLVLLSSTSCAVPYQHASMSTLVGPSHSTQVLSHRHFKLVGGPIHPALCCSLTSFRPLPPPRWRAGAFASALLLSPSSPCTTSARGTFPYQPLCVRPVHQHSPELPNRWPSAFRMSRARASTCPRPALPGASERMQRSYPVKAVPRQMRCSLAQQSRRSSPCVFCLSCTTPFLLHPASLRTLLPRRRGP